MQNITAVPNQFFTQSFRVKAGASPGTYVINLYVYSNATSSNPAFTYYIPILVLQPSQPQPVQQFSEPYAQYAALAIVIAAAIIAAAIAVRRRRKSTGAPYDPARAAILMRIRNRMKPQETEEKAPPAQKPSPPHAPP